VVCSSSAWLALGYTSVLCSLATPHVKFTISHEHFKGKLRDIGQWLNQVESQIESILGYRVICFMLLYSQSNA